MFFTIVETTGNFRGMLENEAMHACAVSDRRPFYLKSSVFPRSAGDICVTKAFLSTRSKRIEPGYEF